MQPQWHRIKDASEYSISNAGFSDSAISAEEVVLDVDAGLLEVLSALGGLHHGCVEQGPHQRRGEEGLPPPI